MYQHAFMSLSTVFGPLIYFKTDLTLSRTSLIVDFEEANMPVAFCEKGWKEFPEEQHSRPISRFQSH